MRKKPSKQAITFQQFLQKVKRRLSFQEQALQETKFYIFRTDTNQVLARGIEGYDAAKERANQLRHHHGLKWDQVKFRSERRSSSNFGVSADGKRFTNAHGQSSPIDYSRSVNPSKGRRFRGYYDKHGNFHDID